MAPIVDGDAVVLYNFRGDRAIEISRAFEDDAFKVQLLTGGMGYECEPPVISRGYWLDRLVYRLNPQHNPCWPSCLQRRTLRFSISRRSRRLCST